MAAPEGSVDDRWDLPWRQGAQGGDRGPPPL